MIATAPKFLLSRVGLRFPLLSMSRGTSECRSDNEGNQTQQANSQSNNCTHSRSSHADLAWLGLQPNQEGCPDGDGDGAGYFDICRGGTPDLRLANLVTQKLKAGDLPMHVLNVLRYSSKNELQDYLQDPDCPNGAQNLTVFLLLGDQVRGQIQDWIRRTSPGFRLILASTTGRLPGLTSPGDLSLHADSLGWQSINFYRQIGDALVEALQPIHDQECCVLILPGDELDNSWRGHSDQAACNPRRLM